MTDAVKQNLGERLVEYFQAAMAHYTTAESLSPSALTAHGNFHEAEEVLAQQLKAHGFNNANERTKLCRAIEALAEKAAKLGGDFKEAAFFEQALGIVKGPEHLEHVLRQSADLQKGIDAKMVATVKLKVEPSPKIANPKHEGVIGGILKHRYKIGAGVAALAVGAWALGEANKRNEAENQPKQL